MVDKDNLVFNSHIREKIEARLRSFILLQPDKTYPPDSDVDYLERCLAEIDRLSIELRQLKDELRHNGIDRCLAD